MCFEDALAGICRAPISITIEIDPAAMVAAPEGPKKEGGSIVDRDHKYADDVMKDFCDKSSMGKKAPGTEDPEPSDDEKDDDEEE